MTSLKEDLERAATALRAVTKHEVEVVSEPDDHCIYVNFGYLTALVITTQFTQHGQEWHVAVWTWDRSGGVESEQDLGWVRFAYLHGVVKEFLDRQDEQERQLAEILDSRPDD